MIYTLRNFTISTKKKLKSHGLCPVTWFESVCCRQVLRLCCGPTKQLLNLKGKLNNKDTGDNNVSRVNCVLGNR